MEKVCVSTKSKPRHPLYEDSWLHHRLQLYLCTSWWIQNSKLYPGTKLPTSPHTMADHELNAWFICCRKFYLRSSNVFIRKLLLLTFSKTIAFGTSTTYSGTLRYVHLGNTVTLLLLLLFFSRSNSNTSCCKRLLSMWSPINTANGHILNSITVGAGWPEWRPLDILGTHLPFSEAAS